MTGLSAPDVTTITRRIHADARAHDDECTPLTDDQVGEVVALALELYAVAARHGISRDNADGVTSFSSAALDSIRMRDRHLRSSRGGGRSEVRHVDGT
jgi:hypothetical protein